MVPRKQCTRINRTNLIRKSSPIKDTHNEQIHSYPEGCLSVTRHDLFSRPTTLTRFFDSHFRLRTTPFRVWKHRSHRSILKERKSQTTYLRRELSDYIN